MRKWYGAGERPTDGGVDPEPEEPEEPAEQDVVLVTEADSPIGEQVVLQLILARQQLKLLVRDVGAAKTAYGPYATPVPADAASSAAPRVMRGVKCVVLLGRPSRGLLEAARAAGVRHVVVLAAAQGLGGATGGGGFSLGGFMGLGGGGAAGRELRQLADAEAESAVRASGLPYSVVQVAGLVDAGRGGADGAGVEVTQRSAGQGLAGGRGVSREALGALVAGLVDVVPSRGRTLQALGPSGDGGSPSASPQQQQEAIATMVATLMEDS